MSKIHQTTKISNLFRNLLFCFLSVFLFHPVFTQNLTVKTADQVIVGAQRIDQYFDIINGQRLAIVANHTSMIGSTHLVDSLKSLGFNIKKVFGPEHGFRGNADAGAKVNNDIDEKTGIPIISLYGKNKKPTQEQLEDVDIIIFDIQDVGARFYTFISTMTYVMEACAEKKIRIIILDRPNPNGHYVDGPILESEYKSFVGLHPVPIVHGMTVGEYACMISEEGWLAGGTKCDLTVIPCLGYDHTVLYQLPIKPSPNLPTMESIYLYPSLCLFEGTSFSMGRGTDKPFQIIGHPEYNKGNYEFTPKSKDGAKNPKHEGLLCKGYDLTDEGKKFYHEPGKLHVKWVIECYQNFIHKDDFFKSYFNTLAGNKKLKEQIELGLDEEEIKKTWVEGLTKFSAIRKKYLIYPDF
jgi:uncharacterized protein YbbC (DUF1343 family)